MPCNLRKQDINDIVLTTVREVEGWDTIRLSTKFWSRPYWIDKTARERYLPGIINRIQARGCSLSRAVSAQDIAEEATPQGIANLVADNIS
jgi:hypothetical protein